MDFYLAKKTSRPTFGRLQTLHVALSLLDLRSQRPPPIQFDDGSYRLTRVIMPLTLPPGIISFGIRVMAACVLAFQRSQVNLLIPNFPTKLFINPTFPLCCSHSYVLRRVVAVLQSENRRQRSLSPLPPIVTILAKGYSCRISDHPDCRLGTSHPRISLYITDCSET